MLGIFMVQAWQEMGSPDDFHLAEIGPGRGTMMADMLRVIKKLAPAMFDAASIHLVETSDRLKRIQSQTLIEDKLKISWHDGFDGIPHGPLLLAANELFDAIPIRQFIKTEQGFRERMISVDANENLAFTAGAAGLDSGLLPGPADKEPLGAIVELAPARMAVMQALCERLYRQGGVALIIDYGHTSSGYGDTLQAIRDHRYDPPLAHPGEADLTSHVDFEDLVRAAEFCQLNVAGLMQQGDYVTGLGILERAGALGSGKDPETQAAISKAVERLAGRGEGNMGELFKVLAISNPVHKLPPFHLNDK
jgi:SAM-dependent MidA family methyltransferase